MDTDMKAKIWVLCTVLADENAPAMPAVFGDEAEAWAKYDEVIRAEWDSTMDPDIDGPYAKINYTYDELSRVIRTRYFDSENLEIVRVMFVVVRSVLPGSMAERIGLAPGDWIISYNGEKVTSVHQLVQLVTDARGPASRILVIHRGFTILNFEVAAGLLGINIEAAPAELEVTPRE